ncbi:MAG TPA: ABC transporter ATP-binding protein [Bauldia sp.]|nr:ABC transporter ATP-binding protein [Bauldia sp.]
MFAAFERLVDPYPAAEPEMPPRGLFAFCYHYTRPFLVPLIAMAALTALISVIEIVFFAFIGDLVDWLSAADRATFLDVHGGELIVMGLVVVVGFPLATLLQNLFMFQSIYGNFPMLVRWKAHRYILGQSLDFFHNEFAGRVSQKVMQTALAVRETVTKILDVFVYVVVYFIGTLYLVGRADLWLTLPLVIWLAAYVGILVFFIPRLQRISMVQADARAQMTGRVVDSYTNIQTIKLFAHTLREQDYARDAMDEFMVTVYRQMRLVTELNVSLHVANSLLLAAVAGVAIYGWLEDIVSLGAIAVAIALVMRIRAMSQWILWETANLFENIGTVADGITTIAQPVAITDKPKAEELNVSRGEIVFDHARFHYGRQHKVIEDFSLVIAPGEKVGLVGRSGAGKSTLVNLLLRFYDLEGGRILIDGQDISKVTQESLRRQIGMVTQDTSLLHRSVRENIAYGRPDATEEEIVAAARQAEADDFIRDLADAKGRKGYDAHVGERGVKLSGGQRQRIAIARVLLKDAPILILDEATSALDSEVEAAIQGSLYRLMEGKTVIAIAHRLSTIAAMDRLVVLDHGRIAEIGSHDELLRRGGLYAQLWSRQSGGFLDVGLMQAVGA